jgi:hypothetical protein
MAYDETHYERTTAMFGNRVISVQLAKKPKPGKNDTTTDSKEIDWDVVGQKAAIAQETTETIAKVVIGTYVAKKLIDTACQIAVIAAEAKIK